MEGSIEKKIGCKMKVVGYVELKKFRFNFLNRWNVCSLEPKVGSTDLSEPSAAGDDSNSSSTMKQLESAAEDVESPMESCSSSNITIPSLHKVCIAVHIVS